MPLFSAFAEGLFSAVADDVRLIDGNENSYYYTGAAAFDQSRKDLLKGINYLAADYQDRARARVQFGQAIYADVVLNL